MTLNEAYKIVKEASTAEGQLKMKQERWELVNLARKIVANHFVENYKI